MKSSTSELFEFFENCSNFTIEKHVITSPDFSNLRRNVRRMVFMLREHEEEASIMASAQLRQALSEWLTSPVVLSESMHSILEESLGKRSSISQRWGSDLAECFESAWISIQTLSKTDSPLRAALLSLFKELRSNKKSFKIYCHRRGREHFNSIVRNEPELLFQPEDFLHTAAQYEATKPSDTLIKVGPLRATGWGKVPDAIVNAPRFSTIHQFVWPACGDDEDFGFDAAAPEPPPRVSDEEIPGKEKHVKPKLIWHMRQSINENNGSREAINSSGIHEDEDDLLLFRESYKDTDGRSAVLVQLDEQHGILYPRFSSVLSLDAHTMETEAIKNRLVWEGLQEGMFVIFPLVIGVDLGDLKAEHGSYSSEWRQLLQQKWIDNPELLVQRLHAQGLNLVHLHSAIRNWIKPPDTVIHAPQSVNHFRILMKELGLEQNSANNNLNRRTRVFWEEAWLEVRRSRGEAIQAGFQEHEIVEEQIIDVLQSILEEIKEKAFLNDQFSLDLPSGRGLDGLIRFNKVLAIEEGYQAPQSELKVINNITRLDTWRA